MEGESKRLLCNTFFDTMLLLRNGAVAAGHSHLTHKFREQCLEQVFYTLSVEVIPELVKAGILDIYNDEQWGSVCDVALLYRKKAMP